MIFDKPNSGTQVVAPNLQVVDKNGYGNTLVDTADLSENIEALQCAASIAESVAFKLAGQASTATVSRLILIAVELENLADRIRA